ncbi:MAG: undecaprenyl-diphosphate phosphatase [Deltaproteobacteria bacterium]|nr:undecaprenyl-diphosphate phosphatase [Deltaproteobacteria bacterium]
MNILQALGLGVLQGVTEFLPISSSGHLVLGKAILNVHTKGVAYEVFVHFGTFLAILTIFWGDIWQMLRALGRALRHPSPNSWRRSYREDFFLRLVILIALGTIPAVVVGLLFESEIEAAFSNPLFVSVALIITGTILLGTRWSGPRDTQFGMMRALLIGVAQSFAILPGISRSGSTIAAAMYLRVDRSEAARFSFLLALPAILGAAVLESVELLRSGVPSQQAVTLLVGTIAAYISGMIALKWLLGVIRRGRLDRFSYYCFAVGLVSFVWFARSAFL